MNPDRADAVPSLGSIAGHAATRVARAAPTERARDVVARLLGHRFDALRDLPVCDGERLVGMLRIEDLVASPDELVSALMDRDPPTVAPGVDEEVAAWRAVQHGESSLAVVDEDGALLGVVPAQPLLGVLLAEHDEDVARLAGVRGTADPARAAAAAPVRRRLADRLPWLILGLTGALAATGIMSAFEQRLAANITVAFFVPGIVYMADAVGTQTEALVIRGFSVGVGIRSIALREVITGVLVGAFVALLFVPIGLLVWHEAAVVFAVAIALFAACSTATLVALALPSLIDRMGLDPAYGSGPLATVVQDLLSLLIYFAAVTAFVV